MVLLWICVWCLQCCTAMQRLRQTLALELPLHQQRVDLWHIQILVLKHQDLDSCNMAIHPWPDHSSGSTLHFSLIPPGSMFFFSTFQILECSSLHQLFLHPLSTDQQCSSQTMSQLQVQLPFQMIYNWEGHSQPFLCFHEHDIALLMTFKGIPGNTAAILDTFSSVVNRFALNSGRSYSSSSASRVLTEAELVGRTTSSLDAVRVEYLCSVCSMCFLLVTGLT